ARVGARNALPWVVGLVDSRGEPEMTLKAVETIRALGVPQRPLPGQKSQPAVTATELLDMVRQVNGTALSERWRRRRGKLLQWLEARAERGVGPEGCRIGGVRIRPGDWILMRESSPYNRFTNLSPGLFTHAGVAARHEDSNGVHHLVLVDVNERQPTVQAENVEETLFSPLYYALLRPETRCLAQKVDRRASSAVGNPLQFDLTFDLSLLRQASQKPIEDAAITTYCTGILALCTPVRLRKLFLIREAPAAGHTRDNLRKLGITIGKQFVSPTGALFASRMNVVTLSDPQFDPQIAVEQGIYDYFARRLSQQPLDFEPSLIQACRQELAQLSDDSSLVASTLANLSGVHPDMDLTSAARVAAVIESLDQIVFRYGRRIRRAQSVLGLRTGTRGGLRPATDPLEDRQRMWEELQSVRRRMRAGKLPHWQAVNELVDRCILQGQEAVSGTFFAPDQRHR
ncbi:MAG: hypothetical protein ACOC7K_02520, partial [bacterium]